MLLIFKLYFFSKNPTQEELLEIIYRTQNSAGAYNIDEGFNIRQANDYSSTFENSVNKFK